MRFVVATWNINSVRLRLPLVKRHLAVELGVAAGLARPITIHNFYVPAGGDEPDPEVNEKFAHKLAFLDELAVHAVSIDAKSGARSILVGDLNVAPLEHDRSEEHTSELQSRVD